LVAAGWKSLGVASCALISALAVLVAAGGAGARGVAFVCGDTITADTTLTTNVTGCAGDGLIVAASGVRLDLNGHVVSGSGAGTGITVSGANVQVVGGTVRSFGVGVSSPFGSDGTRLERLAVSGNGTGVSAGSQSGVVDHSNLAENVGNGLTARGSGWTVEDSEVSGNGGAGVSFFFAGGATIARDVITRNAGSGIDFLAHVDQSVIADNVLSRNGAFGIRVLDSTTRVLRNVARKNGDTGILLSEGENPASVAFYEITGNASSQNDGAGIVATAGMPDGGGNSAKQNGATPECVNVACK
jgi:hypothetical protein